MLDVPFLKIAARAVFLYRRPARPAASERNGAVGCCVPIDPLRGARARLRRSPKFSHSPAIPNGEQAVIAMVRGCLRGLVAFTAQRPLPAGAAVTALPPAARRNIRTGAPAPVRASTTGPT
jgi:hypothetical protein